MPDGNRKRKADAIGRLSETSSKASGRGSLVGWTACPLCGRHSQKKYALGRGIATHLHAVHTPWNPGKKELKKRRRERERLQAELAKKKELPGVGATEALGRVEILQEREPDENEREAWAKTVLDIVADLELTMQEKKESEDSGVGRNRNGEAVVRYNDSLPPFIRAAADGDLVTLTEMVDQQNTHEEKLILLDTKDRHLSSADHWAAGGGHLSCLRYLLRLRQDCSGEISPTKSKQARIRRRDGKTCLHYAARNGRTEIALFLIDEQLQKVDEKSGDGSTPLHLACFGAHFSMVELLIAKGANVKESNEWGCNAAHWIGMSKSQEKADVWQVCSLLRSMGVSFDEQQSQGHTALHKAAQKLNRHAIEWLMADDAVKGAALKRQEIEKIGRPDQGGHVPSALWIAAGGDPAFAKKMEVDWKW